MYDKTNAPRNVVAAFASRWEHVRRHVAATFRGDKSLRVYRSGDNLLGETLRGDKSLRVCWWIHVQIFVLAGNKSHRFSLFGTMGRGREKIDTFLVFPSRGRSWRFKDLFCFYPSWITFINEFFKIIFRARRIRHLLLRPWKEQRNMLKIWQSSKKKIIL